MICIGKITSGIHNKICSGSEVSTVSKKNPTIGNNTKKTNIVTFVNLVFGKLNISLCEKNKL